MCCCAASLQALEASCDQAHGAFKIYPIVKLMQLSSSWSFQAPKAFATVPFASCTFGLIGDSHVSPVSFARSWLKVSPPELDFYCSTIIYIFPVIKFQYFDSTTLLFPSNNLFFNCSKHHFFLEAMKWLIADLQNWQDCKNWSEVFLMSANQPLLQFWKTLKPKGCLLCTPGNIYWNLQKQPCKLEPGMAHCFNNGKLRTLMAPLAKSGWTIFGLIWQLFALKVAHTRNCFTRLHKYMAWMNTIHFSCAYTLMKWSQGTSLGNVKGAPGQSMVPSWISLCKLWDLNMHGFC